MGQGDRVYIAGNVHRVCEFQQGNVCPILEDVEVRVWDNFAHSQQVVMVIEVLLLECYSDHVGVNDFSKEKRYSLRKSISLPETQRWCVMIPSYPTLLPIPCPTLPGPERLTVPHSVPP